MKNKYGVTIFAIILMVTLLLSCNSYKQPILPTTPTSTLFFPVHQGTLLPSVYEPITDKSAKSVALLATWNIYVKGDFFAFSTDSNSIVIGQQVFNVIDGGIASLGEEPFPVTVQNTKALRKRSNDGRFYYKINKYGNLEFRNEDAKGVYLYFYFYNASNAFFLPDDENILIAFTDGQIWFVKITDWKQELMDLESGHTGYPRKPQPQLVLDTQKGVPQKIYLSPNNSLMAFTFQDNTVQIWNMTDLVQIATITSPEQPTNLAFNEDGRLIVTGSEDGMIHIWNVQDGKLLATLKDPQGNRIDAFSFSHDRRLLASLNGNWVSIWGILPIRDPESVHSTATVEAHLNPIVTFTSVPLPRPTSTPTSSLPSYTSFLPLAWPVPVPTDEQLKDAKVCPIESLANSRYPNSLSYWQLESTFEPQSACDWAALATAYTMHINDEYLVPDEGKSAFAQAVLLNPAFAFQTSLFYQYFGSLDLVEAPSLVNQPITSLTVDYEWSGMGEPSSITYHIEVTHAHLQKEIKVVARMDPQGITGQVPNAIDPTLIQQIGAGFRDFLPTRSPITLEYCTDNSPNWKADLILLDDTKISLATYGSNLFNAGGPWQTQINGQYYFQFSSALTNAFVDLLDNLNLPLGQPWATYCAWDDFFDLAYP